MISQYGPAFVAGWLLATIGFGFYAEFGPGMGSVLIRPNDKGEKVLTLTGLLVLMAEPLHNRELWRLNQLDINYFVMATTGGLLGISVKSFYL